VNTKAKGSRNERRSRTILESSGYRVTRAAGSLGPWDLVGVSSTDVVLVQVKTRDWPSGADTEFLRNFKVPANVKKLLHRWRDGNRLPDVREVGS
jgi:Holliday junction resolvase